MIWQQAWPVLPVGPGDVSVGASSSSSSHGGISRAGGPQEVPVEADDAVAGPPRMAFAERLSTNVAQPPTFAVSLVMVCVVEAAVFVPTLRMELELDSDPWAPMLRVLIAIVRLMPIAFTCIARCGCASFLSDRLDPLERVDDDDGTPSGLRFLVAVLRRCFARCVASTTHAALSAELRWGVAITLDMWYLLNSPLNRVGKGSSYTLQQLLILIVNVLLCFGDTVMLIVNLLSRQNDEVLEDPPRTPIEPVQFCMVKIGAPAEDSSLEGQTCIICLGDLWTGDDVVQLPCSHAFHQECIGKWLLKSRMCPLRCTRHSACSTQVTATSLEVDVA
eukprot:TRINITY_DN25143_c0_g1_i1.p1 TRINITY_DN25143_c0_g1~~TRINITY_DN25143_c0_g1_i1.p1  ORF type:complete len:333 (-),score=48.87 TRINITY_DN25143_c0_g1_i1:215-1213(-)